MVWNGGAEVKPGGGAGLAHPWRARFSRIGNNCQFRYAIRRERFLMPTRNVNLTDHFDNFIQARIKSGRFSNASEVVREGLRLLEQRERKTGRSSNGSVRPPRKVSTISNAARLSGLDRWMSWTPISIKSARRCPPR